MTTKQILSELECYLSPLHITRLKMEFRLDKDITICMVIGDIIKEYNSSQSDENIVGRLLVRLLKNYFNRPSNQ